MFKSNVMEKINVMTCNATTLWFHSTLMLIISLIMQSALKATSDKFSYFTVVYEFSLAS